MTMLIAIALVAAVAVRGFQLSSSRQSFSPYSSLKMISGKLLVVQNKGGGHGTLGYQLCKNIKTANPDLAVVMLQDKCNRKKEPFNAYDELTALGVEIVEENLSDMTIDTLPASIAQASFDYIVDNWSKSPETCQTFVQVAQKSSSQYVFVSSGGMYKNANIMPLTETDEVKDNGARNVEKTVIAANIPYTFIRPQYFYGPKTSKRYLDFFIGRAARKLAIPLPLSGQQLVCLTHIDDAASLIEATIGNPKAKNEVFNCGSDEFITYQGLCTIIHDCMSNDVSDRKFLYYEPKLFDKWDGSGVMEFPFRRETFTVSSTKAKVLLGWKPKYSISTCIKDEIDAYVAMGGLKEEWSLDQLKYDFEIMASKDLKVMFTYPFFDNVSINPESRPYPFESASAPVASVDGKRKE